jgi:hypothetical protein
MKIRDDGLDEYRDNPLETVDDVVRYYARGPRKTHDEALVRTLVERMVSMRDPFVPEGVDSAPVTPAKAHRWINTFSLLYENGTLGWLDREGRFYSCAYAAHERLLDWLGWETADLERAGWARVGPHGTQCLFRLSPAQRRAINKAGRLFDAEKDRLKPVWTETGTSRPGDTPLD